MSGIWNMSIWNVILHKKKGIGLIFSTVLLVEAAHSRDIATFVKKSLFTRKYYVYMTLTQLALSASMFHAF